MPRPTRKIGATHMNRREACPYQCEVCERHRPARSMPTTRLHIWKDGRHQGWREVQWGWCNGCADVASRRNGRGSEYGEEARARIAAIREAVMMTTWDGRSTKECAVCTEALPDAIFPSIADSHTSFYRHPNCIRCGRAGRAVKISKSKFRAVSPFDQCASLITTQTGREYAQWTRDDHSNHTLLMREMCSHPHHQSRLGPHASIPSIDDPKIEALWEARMDVLLEAVGTSRTALRAAYESVR